MGKIKPNDKCHCGSEKKYKKCCSKTDMDKRFEESNRMNHGHDIPDEDEELLEVKFFFEEEYKKHKVINITNYLTNDTYRPYQINHYKNKVIMIAKRQPSNNVVFETRGPKECNVMIMYKGAYRCYNSVNFERALSQVCGMIDDQDAKQ